MCAKKSLEVKSPVGNPAFDVGFTKKVSNPVRCGVIGLGRIGWAHHCSIIRQHGGFELGAVCDLEKSRREEALAANPGCVAYGSLKDILKDDSIELLVVSTQSVDHEDMAVQALKAGKHVLCEKPSALSAKGIKRMIAAARKAGRKLTMHHNYRLNPELLYVREVIESGAIGKPFRIKRRVQGFGRRNDWQTLLKYGGGMTGNWGIHLVDQCLQLLDSPVVEVWGVTRQVFNPGDAEDDIKAIIRCESGMLADIDMTSACAAPEPSWVVLGSCGTLWLQAGKAHLKRFNPKKLPRVKVNDLHYSIDRKYGVVPEEVMPWEEREEEINPKGSYDTYYDNLYYALRKGRPLLVEPESALLTYQILDKIKRNRC